MALSGPASQRCWLIREVHLNPMEAKSAEPAQDPSEMGPPWLKWASKGQPSCVHICPGGITSLWQIPLHRVLPAVAFLWPCLLWLVCACVGSSLPQTDADPGWEHEGVITENRGLHVLARHFCLLNCCNNQLGVHCHSVPPPAHVHACVYLQIIYLYLYKH